MLDDSTAIELMDREVIFPIEQFEYKQLFDYVYPINEDRRSHSEMVLDDAKYFINRHLNMDGRYYNSDLDAFEFPVRDIYYYTQDAADTNELRTVLQSAFKINENDCVVYKELSSSSEEDEVSRTELDIQERDASAKDESDSDWNC